jgi:transforming growth factor-beta-induced protein
VKITDAALTQATVAAADVNAVNGIIHVVDKVLVPPGVLNVVQMAQVNPATFSTLVSSVVSAGLKDTLSGAGPFTLFAPTNVAFTGAPTLTAAQLPFVLKYHVVSGQVLASGISFGSAVTTLNTNNLSGGAVQAQTFIINNNPLAITDKTATAAPITATDVRASNGVIHVLSKVLIPN